MPSPPALCGLPSAHTSADEPGSSADAKGRLSLPPGSLPGARRLSGDAHPVASPVH